MEITRGSLYWVDLDPTRGSEIKKRRPCVVIGVDPVNNARRTVVVIPLSSAGKEHPPLAVGVACLNKQAIAVVDHIRAVDKSRLIQKCGVLTPDAMSSVEKGLQVVLGL
jgi:mRNA interferase MazF